MYFIGLKRIVILKEKGRSCQRVYLNLCFLVIRLDFIYKESQSYNNNKKSFFGFLENIKVYQRKKNYFEIFR